MTRKPTPREEYIIGMWINPVWRRVRAILFQPCRTLDAGRPWEDLQ